MGDVTQTTEQDISNLEQMWRDAAATIGKAMPSVAVAIVILLVFWLMAAAVARLVLRVGARAKVNPDVLGLLAWSGRVTVLAVGVVTACGTMHIDIGALLAGLGLTGFAIGFALKDIISNFLSGMLILVYEPFRRGDFINVGGLEGNVIAIDFRYTSLQKDDSVILVPNANLFVKEIIVKRR
ncbi:MAG TPA: mechanosensitive ion channel domain-containing protein [Pirellulales bacterium]|nr:mechanosensitive ion channel domain-containing protein [Pirellulales bacterium]